MDGTTSAFCDSFLRHQGIKFHSSSRTSYKGLGTRLIVKNKWYQKNGKDD
jgi:hypothetical protein